MARPTDYMRTEQQRKEYERRARAAMLRHMELNNMDQDTLAAKHNVTKRTIQNRLESPGTMQLKDLWDMAIYLKCPLGEICGGDLPEEMIGKLLAAGMKAM